MSTGPIWTFNRYPLDVSGHEYPLAPEKLAILYDILIDYCQKISDEFGIKDGDVKKLFTNLGNKFNFVLYDWNVQLYLTLGMKLTKIHRMLKFKQSDWMKGYINFNTEKRKKTTNIFEKYVFKLIINSVYGKTMENLGKIIVIGLVNNKKDFFKIYQQTTHIFHKSFDKIYAAIHEIKPVLTLSKPIYVGFTVLKLSKWLLYDFYYNFIKKHLILNCYLLTQTASLMKSNQKIFMKNFLNTNICLI